MSAVEVVLRTGIRFLFFCLNFMVLIGVGMLFPHAPCPSRHADNNGGKGEQKHEIDKENDNVGEERGVELRIVDERHVKTYEPEQAEDNGCKGDQNDQNGA